MQTYHVKTNITGAVATVEFFHPKSNSFPSTQLTEMVRTFVELGKNDNVKAIILKSPGKKVFSAGASFEELLAISNYRDARKYFINYANMILAMRYCPKFIIGCITGKIVGGGVALAAACDYALADTEASAKLSKMSAAIGPFIIEPPITRKIGMTSFSELAINPDDWRSAEWLKERGMYNAVYKDATSCETGVAELAQQLCVYGIDTISHLKSIFWEENEDLPKLMQKRAEMSAKLFFTQSAKEILLNLKS